MTFYALLSLFSAMTAIVSLYGLVADLGTVEGQLDTITRFVPNGGVDIIRDQVHRLTQSPTSGLSAGVIVGLPLALWRANGGTKAIFSAPNDVYGDVRSAGSFV